jgi:hypothetical protein
LKYQISAPLAAIARPILQALLSRTAAVKIMTKMMIVMMMMA